MKPGARPPAYPPNKSGDGGYLSTFRGATLVHQVRVPRVGPITIRRHADCGVDLRQLAMLSSSGGLTVLAAMRRGESLEANDFGVCRFGGGMEIVHAAKLDPTIE